MKLYELSDNIRALDQLEETEQVKLALEQLEGDFKDKALNLGKYYRELSANADMIDSEIKRLVEKKQSLVKKAEYIRQYLLDNMLSIGVEKIDDPIVKLAIRTNPPSCEIINVMDLPVEYRKLIPESWQADRMVILAHFKTSGEIPNGAIIKTDNKRLDIK